MDLHYNDFAAMVGGRGWGEEEDGGGRGWGEEEVWKWMSHNDADLATSFDDCVTINFFKMFVAS